MLNDSVSNKPQLLTIYLVGELCERGAMPEVNVSQNELDPGIETVETIEITSRDGRLRFSLKVASTPSTASLPPVLWQIWQDEICCASGELLIDELNRDLELAWEAWCSTCCEWGIQRFSDDLLEAVEDFATYYDLD